MTTGWRCLKMQLLETDSDRISRVGCGKNDSTWGPSGKMGMGGTSKALIPGLINTLTHIPIQLLRRLADDLALLHLAVWSYLQNRGQTYGWRCILGFPAWIDKCLQEEPLVLQICIISWTGSLDASQLNRVCGRCFSRGLTNNEG